MDAPAEARLPGGLLGGLRRAGALLLRLPRRWAWAPALSWCALIWTLSARTARPAVDYVTLREWLTNSGHAVLYGLLALWCALALPRRAGWPVLDVAPGLVVLACVLAYGTVDELHQAFVPGRNAAVPDVVTDLVGATCTLWIAAYVGRGGATGAGLARRLALGLAACFAAGAVATFAPALWPDAAWL
jgi:VanZ family protein